MKLKLAVTLALAALALGTTAPKTFADGMIIPAYLPLTDATNWNILKEGAASFTAGTSSVYNDYFVVVNGPANGPFTTAADWAKARTLWDPIVVNNGEIFGYVHTLTTPTSTMFRPLADVERDVTRWVNGYGNLNGIWIDEFYPRYEITDSNAYPTPATFPNGQSNAPTDRSFVKNGIIDGAVQVNPTGGYYSQLTNWIHAHYPDLKLIGNEGGHFYSNQAKYGSLMTVTCSFEETYANASANNWTSSNFARLPGTEAFPQLSLIHTNSVDLNGAIDQSIAKGYKYFYTTNRLLNNNIWGGLPPYFTSEVQYIANHQ